MYLLKVAIALMTAPTFLLFAGSSIANEPTDKVSAGSEERALGELPTLRRLVPNTAQASPLVTPATISRQRLPLSPGDRIRVFIPGVGGEEFSGEYEVSFNGDLNIPFLDPVSVTGLSEAGVQEKLSNILIERQLFRPDLLKLSVQVLDYSPIQVAITGEVFEPGRVLLAAGEESAVGEVEGEIVELPGDNPLERYLTSALKAIGGVRPTADVSKVQVLRGTESIVVDLSGIFSGSTVADFPLVAGDQVIVPESGMFEAAYVRPSQITPDNVDLYVSNVTQPSGNAALQGLENVNVASFEYGTNLAQALVAARCVGGTRTTNANRRALLIQTDDMTGALTTSEYSVNNLISNRTQSIEDNPFIMPEDAIACYDSRNANVRGILGTVTDFLNPINLLFNLFDNNIFNDNNNN